MTVGPSELYDWLKFKKNLLQNYVLELLLHRNVPFLLIGNPR